MPKHIAQQQAIDKAVAQLREVEFAERCERLGLARLEHESVKLRVLATDYELSTTDYRLRVAGSGTAAKPDTHILVLHYLLHDGPLGESDGLISFRDFPGGRFYYGPFRDRSVNVLAKRIGNNLESLRARLNRFDWTPAGTSHIKGDMAARIHFLGPLHVTLIYHVGDEEFGPEANLLFDKGFARVFDAEDAAVVAGKVCFGLL